MKPPMGEQIITVEKYVTFTLNGGEWDIQLWPTGYRPLTGKLYKITVPVPAELIGTVQASIEPVE